MDDEGKDGQKAANGAQGDPAANPAADLLKRLESGFSELKEEMKTLRPPAHGPSSPADPPPASSDSKDPKIIIANMTDAELRTTLRKAYKGESNLADEVIDFLEEERDKRLLQSSEQNISVKAREIQAKNAVQSWYGEYLKDQNSSFAKEYAKQLNAVYSDPYYKNVPEKDFIAANYAAAILGVVPKKEISRGENDIPEKLLADLESGKYPVNRQRQEPKEPEPDEDDKRFATRLGLKPGTPEFEKKVKALAAEKAVLKREMALNV